MKEITMRYDTKIKMVGVIVLAMILVSCSHGSDESKPYTWGAAQAIETDSAGNAYAPDIVFDSKGNAFAIWYWGDGTNVSVRTNRYTAGVGWGTAVAIDNHEGYDGVNMGYPHIAVDGAGNALAVWTQSDGIRNSIWANRYTAGVGWEMAQVLGTDDSVPLYRDSGMGWLQMAMDSNGNAIAVWPQYEDFLSSIWSNRYTIGEGWGTAELIESDDTYDAMYPEMAMDSNGNALVVWEQNALLSNTYIVGQGWGTPQEVYWYGEFMQLAFDSNNEAILVSSDRPALVSLRFSWDTGWEEWNDYSMIFVEHDPYYYIFPQLAIDSNDNAMFVWYDDNGIRTLDYTPESGWGMDQYIGPAGGYFPEIAFDPCGNALAMWSQGYEEPYSIGINTYTPGSGWGTASLFQTGHAEYNSKYPRFAFDHQGRAMAVWEQWDGTHYSIWSKRYE